MNSVSGSVFSAKYSKLSLGKEDNRWQRSTFCFHFSCLSSQRELSYTLFCTAQFLWYILLFHIFKFKSPSQCFPVCLCYGYVPATDIKAGFCLSFEQDVDPTPLSIKGSLNPVHVQSFSVRPGSFSLTVNTGCLYTQCDVCEPSSWKLHCWLWSFRKSNQYFSSVVTTVLRKSHFIFC